MAGRAASIITLLLTRQQSTRDRFRQLERERPDFRVHAWTGPTEPLERVVDGGTHVAVIDLAPDPGEGVETCLATRRQRPELPLVGLVCCERALTWAELQLLRDADVNGVIEAGLALPALAEVLRAVAHGRTVYHIELEDAAQRPPWRAPARPLDGRDAAILRLLLRGKHDKAIAAELGWSDPP